MSDLYIQVQDGQTVNHPVLQQNLMDVFGEIPAHFEEFTRISMPNPGTLGVFQKFQETYETPTYQKVDGVWQDTWTVVDMTAEEKAAKISSVQSLPQMFASWTFNPDTCTWSAPVPLPADSGTGTPPIQYMWNEVTGSWALAPTSAPPETGGPYGWNLADQTWEAAPQDGGTYAWDLAGQTWIAQPTDGKTYRFDPFQHQWVEFTPPA
jgi:hypothetical protein